MKNKTSKNLLGLSNCFLKSIINCIAEPLVHIFHLSLRKGEIPQQLKCAKVVPIFKLKKSVNDEHLDPSFYRPISLLPIFSKILEKNVTESLTEYLRDHDISYMSIRVVPKKNLIITRGKWKSFAHWFQICFYFFPDTCGWFLISDQSFQKPKGGPLDEKNLKKIDFYVWYIKRTALKNVDWKWNRFLKILIFMEVMD